MLFNVDHLCLKILLKQPPGRMHSPEYVVVVVAVFVVVVAILYRSWLSTVYQSRNSSAITLPLTASFAGYSIDTFSFLF